MESVRITDGSEGVFKLYWEAGARVHHDKAEVFDPVEALGAVGLDTSHGDTFNDESWDASSSKDVSNRVAAAGRAGSSHPR
jgi:hypothetical protein